MRCSTALSGSLCCSLHQLVPQATMQALQASLYCFIRRLGSSFTQL